MFKIIVFIISLYAIYAQPSRPASDSSTYAVPCNTKYPFGDEQLLNCDILDNTTRTTHCTEDNNLQDIHGKCPSTETNETLLDPYIFCPNFPVVPPPHEIIFSSSNQPAPEVQCKKCDLRLTPDNSAVILECFQCFDIPSTSRQADMSLPSSYNTPGEYLKDSLDFLKANEWLYNYNNTRVLVNRVFENFPLDWTEYFRKLSNEDLNKMPLNGLKFGLPPTLKDFLDKIESLKPNIQPCTSEIQYAFPHNCGVSEKKLHEISSLSPVIHEICEANNIDFVIDIGSGLGYLSHHLHERYKYKVLGLECSEEFITLAYKNQNKFHPASKDQVTFFQHLITEDSCDTITRQASQRFSQLGLQTCCVVGLHACADLSITILELFSKLPFVKGMVIMPCCYHRIKSTKEDGDEEHFENFPVSKVLSDLFPIFKAQTFLKRPFLRLACQQTISSFIEMTEEEHQKHARSFMFRVVLQEVAETENCHVKRLKRKSHKSHTSDPDEDFEAYLNSLKYSHQLEGEGHGKQLEVNDDAFLRKMREKWNEHKGNCYLVEVLTGLQASIQSICENVILLDRAEFLKERGFYCRVEKVTDDVVSPRCFALVAVKH